MSYGPCNNSIQRVANRVFVIRDLNVMLDADLGWYMASPTQTFSRTPARHRDRFPADFRFQLTADEYDVLKVRVVLMVEITNQLIYEVLKAIQGDVAGIKATLTDRSRQFIDLLRDQLNAVQAEVIRVKETIVSVEVR